MRVIQWTAYSVRESTSEGPLVRVCDESCMKNTSDDVYVCVCRRSSDSYGDARFSSFLFPVILLLNRSECLGRREHNPTLSLRQHHVIDAVSLTKIGLWQTWTLSPAV